MALAATGQLLQFTGANGSHARLLLPVAIPRSVVAYNASPWSKPKGIWGKRSILTSFVTHSSPRSKDIRTDDDGVSLGTMKLPLDIDLPKFEILLFQWANSLCQGANLPLPVPLQVDKIAGGTRLSFIELLDEGKTDVSLYIDCLVYPAAEGSYPTFRAIRNGRMKDKAPPGEERIMKSLLAALQKSVVIARAGA